MKRKSTIIDDELACYYIRQANADRINRSLQWDVIEVATYTARSTFYDYVKGLNVPSVARYNRIAKFFGYPLYQSGRKIAHADSKGQLSIRIEAAARTLPCQQDRLTCQQDRLTKADDTVCLSEKGEVIARYFEAFRKLFEDFQEALHKS